MLPKSTSTFRILFMSRRSPCRRGSSAGTDETEAGEEEGGSEAESFISRILSDAVKPAKKVPVSHRTLRFSPCPARSGSPNRRRKETHPGRAGFRSEPYSGQPAGTIFSGRQLYISMYQAHSQPESSYPRFAACNLRPRVRSAPYRKSPTPERTSCGKTGSIENRGPGRKTYAPRHGNRRKRSL